MYHGANMSHGKHRSGRFHMYGKRRGKPLRWVVEGRTQRKSRDRTEPMFESIAECIEWQQRTHFGRNRDAKRKGTR